MSWPAHLHGPSANATLCTQVGSLILAAGLQQPSPSLMQPLSARCMRALLHFSIGTHPMSTGLGRCSPGPALVLAVSACSRNEISREKVPKCPCYAVTCGIIALPDSVLLTMPCSCSWHCGLWGWPTMSWTALVLFVMLLMMHQPHSL